jgi:8-oxo-dGTP pyrophosphatase MutT (NUDIX family)
LPHIHEKIDFCAEAFIVYQNKVLLRVHDKYGFWLSIGGHVELDEDPTQAVIREVKEEVGLEVELVGEAEKFKENANEYRGIVKPAYMGRHRVNATHEHVVFVYFAKSSDDKVVPEKEGDVFRWFSKEELDDAQYNLSDNVLFYATKALETVK